MHNPSTQADTTTQEPVLITGGTGKTGRRIADRLQRRGIPIRIASRSGDRPFDWQEPQTWDAALHGASAVYLAFSPDLAVPGTSDIVNAFVDRAVAHGIERLVLLSGRGEDEAQHCETLIQRPQLTWTVLRCGWFAQNFSEGPFLDMVKAGEVALPVPDGVREPFVDADDIADVAVAALTEPGHGGEIYELTGPELLTFDQVVAELAKASGRPVRFTPIPTKAFLDGLRSLGMPDGMIWLMGYLFTTVLDGRNAHLTDGVQRALGRPPRTFTDYARSTAATGAWASHGEAVA